jgi:hypothetical protein
MKTIQFLFLTVFISFLTLTLQAQNTPYFSAMKENIGKFKDSKDSPQNLAAAFERIAQAEKSQWLPYYYASYMNIISCFSLKSAEEKDKLIEHVQELINTAYTLNPDSSELMVIQGFLYLAALQADPAVRGAEYSMKANEAFDKAIALNQQNPRGYYLKATTVLNTPDFFGGGKKPAKPIFEKAVTAYNSFVPASEIHPGWGKEECIKQYAACE